MYLRDDEHEVIFSGVQFENSVQNSKFSDSCQIFDTMRFAKVCIHFLSCIRQDDTETRKKRMKTAILVKKLKNNDGATLMLALLFFVMCATVGSIVLTAATASSGRLAGLISDEKGYYAVSSAADLVSDLVEEYDGKLEMEYEDEPSGGSVTDPGQEILLNNLVYQEWKKLGENAVVNDYHFDIFNKELGISDDGDKTITEAVTIKVSDNADLDCSATFTIHENLNLEVEIEPKDSGKNKVVLYFVSQKQIVEEIIQSESERPTEDDENRMTKYKTTLSVSWILVRTERGS